MVKYLSGLTYIFPAEVEHGHTLPSSFTSHPVNKCSFTIQCRTFHILCFLLVIVQFKMASEHNDEMVLAQEDCHVPHGDNTCVGESSLRHELYCCQP